MRSSAPSAGRYSTTSGHRPVSVCHVVPEFAGGGTEQVVLTLLNGVDANAWRSSLVVVGRGEGLTHDAACRGQIECLGFSGSYKEISKAVAAVARLRRLIVAQQPDIVHSHLWPAARLASVALRGLPAAHLVHIHDTRPWLSGSSWRHVLQRVITRRAVLSSDAQYVAVSKAAKDYTVRHLSVDASRVHVVPNGVDLKRFRKGTEPPNYRATFRVGTAGRLSPEKGQRYLLLAAAELGRRGIQCEVWLAGEGSSRAALEELTNALGIGDRVLFAGRVEDMPGFLRQLDVFVLPSLSGEGMPLTILEAMACGICTIASDVGGVSEIIADGDNGFLVMPADVSALVSLLAALAHDRGLRDRVAEAGADAVERSFSVERMVAGVRAIYGGLRPRSVTSSSRSVASASP